MNSRDHILQKVQLNQPDLLEMPSLPSFQLWFEESVEQFQAILQMIGGQVIPLPDLVQAEAAIRKAYPAAKRIVSAMPELSFGEPLKEADKPHSFEDVDVAVIRGQFAVAENAAIWVTGREAGVRVLPFICQNLVLVLEQEHILSTMHEAYQRIGNEVYDYGTFIAGPSKTADIEQSLVLGAHGPKSMSVLLLG